MKRLCPKSFFLFPLLFLILCFSASAQNLSGYVFNEKEEALIGASVLWIGTHTGTTTNEDGYFELRKSESNVLVISYLGYKSDTVNVQGLNKINWILKEPQALETVVVKDKRDGTSISNATVIKTENLNEVELSKAACCDLAGCFNTQLTVQPQTTNVITNAKELRILGLSGVYNQVLIDGFPMIQGLSYTYGISSIPGTVIQNIFISKGANSILQGFESISGQINVITKDPQKSEKLFLNAYLNSFAEKQFNANYSYRSQSGQWSNLTAAHIVQPANKIDRNEDSFLDLPLLTRYVLMNKWKYRDAVDWGWSSTINLRMVNEKRVGGQEDFDFDSDKGSSQTYGQTVEINQPEWNAKISFRPDDSHNFSLYTSGFYQDQNSWFGVLNYDAQQTSLYTNFQYEYTTPSGNNVSKTGLSWRHQNTKEDISFSNTELSRDFAGIYQKKENIPGVFAENTLQLLGGKFTWIAGARLDHHNDFGLKFTPRTLLKYDFGPQAVIRANVGFGWRTVNLFSENINLLVSSRNILIEEELQAEEAWNYGINYTHKIENNVIRGYWSGDFYRTDFQNQIFPDYDTDATKAIIRNFSGKSSANGFQSELFLNFYKQYDFKLGYNFLDVYRKVGGEKANLPFNAKHKVMASIGYTPLNGKFQYDLNLHWFGAARLPNTAQNPEAFQRPEFSDAYATVNTQLTWKFKKLELYGGCENIFDYRQEDPIISAQNPFGKYFDTSFVWGPVRGREFYIGARWKLEYE